MKTAAALACSLAALALVACGSKDFTPEESSPEGERPTTLTQAILGAIRQPEPGQFPTPESAVEFLLEQVRRQDFDEATRVFPIIETYERVTFAKHAEATRSYHPATSPTPGQSLHNLRLPLWFIMFDYDKLTIALLGVHPSYTEFLGREGMKERIAELARRLDVSRLRSLKIKSIELDPVSAKMRSRPIDRLNKAIGVTELGLVNARAECNGQEVRCQFLVGKIGDHWRVLSMWDLDQVPPPPGYPRPDK